MKLIIVDNFNRDYVPDTLIAENVLPFYAEKIADLLNQLESEDSPNFYKAVEDDYRLSKGLEDLV